MHLLLYFTLRKPNKLSRSNIFMCFSRQNMIVKTDICCFSCIISGTSNTRKLYCPSRFSCKTFVIPVLQVYIYISPCQTREVHSLSFFDEKKNKDYRNMKLNTCLKKTQRSFLLLLNQYYSELRHECRVSWNIP